MLSIQEGDWVKVTSRRGVAEAPARLGGIGPGQLFIPFHFGYWDNPGRARAANEMTLFDWDPLSKQPHFKHSAVRVEKVAAPTTKQPGHVDLHPEAAPAPGTLATVAGAAKRAASAVAGLVTPAPKTHLADYIGLLTESEDLLARAFDQTRETHANAPDMPGQCTLMAGWSREAAAALRPFVARYGERREGEPKRLERALMVKRGEGAFDLLRDLQDLFLLANESLVSATILDQAAAALRDEELRAVLSQIRSHNERQREWLIGRCRQAAPQTLTVPL